MLNNVAEYTLDVQPLIDDVERARTLIDDVHEAARPVLRAATLGALDRALAYLSASDGWRGLMRARVLLDPEKRAALAKGHPLLTLEARVVGGAA